MEQNNLNNNLKQYISELQEAFNTRGSFSIGDLMEETKKSLGMGYLDLQKTMKQLQREQTRLKNEMQKELNNASVNGMSSEVENCILGLLQKIEESVTVAQKCV